MKNFNELKDEFKNFAGKILLIGKLNNNVYSLFDSNTKITETFYLNSSNFVETKEVDSNSKNIANNMNLKDLHKYFKEGVDNICCNYNEIKDYLPAFIRESLRITIKKIYIFFDNKKDFKIIEKKYKRYKLKIDFYSFDDYNLAIIETNDIMVGFFKEKYYYFLDSVENLYTYVSNNI